MQQRLVWWDSKKYWEKLRVLTRCVPEMNIDYWNVCQKWILKSHKICARNEYWNVCQKWILMIEMCARNEYWNLTRCVPEINIEMTGNLISIDCSEKSVLGHYKLELDFKGQVTPIWKKQKNNPHYWKQIFAGMYSGGSPGTLLLPVSGPGCHTPGWSPRKSCQPPKWIQCCIETGLMVWEGLSRQYIQWHTLFNYTYDRILWSQD